MAKIVYHVSPFDHSKKKELELKGTLSGILVELELSTIPIALVLNGRNDDDVDLNYETKEDDLIEIFKLVQGEGSSSDKASLATIVQIAALVAVTIISGGSASPYTGAQIAILVGSAVISGALMKRSAELAAASGKAEAETDIATNSYSLVNTNNEARPLSPLPLIMGSHRVAPDIQSVPYKGIFNEQNTVGPADPILDTFYPGMTSGNGATSVTDNWALMPAGYISAGFPEYAIRIAPYHFNPLSSPINPAENAAIIQKVKNDYLANHTPNSFMNWNPLSGEFAPLIVYHSNPVDPFYNRYNVFHFLARYEQTMKPIGITYSDAFNSLFTGTLISIGPGVGSEYKWIKTAALGQQDLIRITPSLDFYYPSTITGNFEAGSVYMPKLATFIKDTVNGGSYASSKAVSYLVPKYYRAMTITSVIREGIEYSTQVFNYGIGDLQISDRKIGLNSVDANDPMLTVYSPILKTGGSPFKWLIPTVSTPNIDYFFYTSVLALDRKQIFNIDDHDTPTPPTDLNQYNFILLEGDLGQNNFNCYITGQIYATTGGGLASNNCVIEVQYKFESETVWRVLDVGLFTIQNDNPKKVSYRFNINEIVLPLDRLQVRIRKMTKDINNNSAGKICNLYIDHIRFVKDFGYYLNFGADERLAHAPQNMEGVSVTALLTDASQTTKLSAMVEAKCWVWDDANLVWLFEHNRNPAWWFLYFAYGGFLLNPNVPPMINSYPYTNSPGWTLYPNHPDAIEIIFGAGLTNDEIDMDRILEWAKFCQNNQLNLDMVFRDDTSCAETLERIANVGRGSVTYYNGKLSVVYEDPEQVPTCMYGMGNIKAGSFNVNYSLPEPIRFVRAKFVNRENWESEEVEAIVPFSDPSVIKAVEISLEGVTEIEQAQREVNILAARQFFQKRTYTWTVDIEGLIAKRGDLVYLSHDSTQYGYSGRVKSFIVESGVVTSITTTSILDSLINYVTIREPNGDMSIYACHISGDTIIFDDPYPIEKASFFITNTEDNALSDYPNSIPEDFIFISGSKETPGKIVRISQIEASGDFEFTITAMDEDPAMWSYEYDDVIPPESFDDSEVPLSVDNVGWDDLGEGIVKIYWENVNGDMIQIINDFTNMPIEANGSYTFTGGEVTLELMPNQKYTLVIKPFAIGTPFKSVDQKVVIWTK